ncbi:MAG: hypothetical protein HY093_02800 [Candidatus Liptonbacteria bacterium]|nr:hypothetical protein [Candidatus Liptonbacteria bacterium]
MNPLRLVTKVRPDLLFRTGDSIAPAAIARLRSRHQKSRRDAKLLAPARASQKQIWS